jgi:hypothetical protein
MVQRAQDQSIPGIVGTVEALIPDVSRIKKSIHSQIAHGADGAVSAKDLELEASLTGTTWDHRRSDRRAAREVKGAFVDGLGGPKEGSWAVREGNEEDLGRVVPPNHPAQPQSRDAGFADVVMTNTGTRISAAAFVAWISCASLPGCLVSG